jgi:hypothetical protein
MLDEVIQIDRRWRRHGPSLTAPRRRRKRMRRSTPHVAIDRRWRLVTAFLPAPRFADVVVSEVAAAGDALMDAMQLNLLTGVSVQALASSDIRDPFGYSITMRPALRSAAGLPLAPEEDR